MVKVIVTTEPSDQVEDWLGKGLLFCCMCASFVSVVKLTCGLCGSGEYRVSVGSIFLWPCIMTHWEYLFK